MGREQSLSQETAPQPELEDGITSRGLSTARLGSGMAYPSWVPAHTIRLRAPVLAILFGEAALWDRGWPEVVAWRVQGTLMHLKHLQGSTTW